jgi:hypothetical protein
LFVAVARAAAIEADVTDGSELGVVGIVSLEAAVEGVVPRFLVVRKVSVTRPKVPVDWMVKT